ncbi:aspartyl-phosphate phosphatase Spo0E family protein [Bacillus taeanensis]|nr:aspartyl-phosphate phosphatase Spo0E family protein [Bacillus taeanensis]
MERMKAIEKARSKMIAKALEKGDFTDKEVIQLSQELDSLILEAQQKNDSH